MAWLLGKENGDRELYEGLWADQCLCLGILTFKEGDEPGPACQGGPCTRPAFGEPLTFTPLMMPPALRRLGHGRTGRNVTVTVYPDGHLETTEK